MNKASKMFGDLSPAGFEAAKAVREIGRSFGGINVGTDAFRAVRQIERAMLPFQPTFQVQRAIADQVRFAGVTSSALQVGRVAESLKLHESILPRGTRDMLELHKASAEHARVFRDADRTWREMHIAAKHLGLHEDIVRQMNRLSEFDRTLGGLLSREHHDPWSRHLKGLLGRGLSMMSHESIKPVGLITALSDAGLGAAISWMATHADNALLMTAAIVPVEPREAENDGAEVLVDGEPACGLCGTPFLNLGEAIRWVGHQRGIRHQLLFPACSNCQERERDEPGYLSRCLEALAEPVFWGVRRVIKGGGKGDGKRRGVLRLVRR